jgi:pimeloyl-ACP methyl ester carboxylesterase/heme-degrading monooxygenase HmoA
MKYLMLLLCIYCATPARTQTMVKESNPERISPYEVLITESHLPGLRLAITHKEPRVLANDFPVLFLHGQSFPTALSFDFRMGNCSWMDTLTENGYDVYALDFLGYGKSDRYPTMSIPASPNADSAIGNPVGRAVEVVYDVDRAVDLILHKTGQHAVYLIGHSWGGSVAALYTEEHSDKVAKLVLFAAITPRRDSSARAEIRGACETLTPEQRVSDLKALTPSGRTCRLEPEIFSIWGNSWLHSDTLAMKYHSTSVRFPSGPAQDVEDLLHNKPYYDPALIKVPVLLIRGEWDAYPNNRDYDTLFGALENSPYKKAVIIEKATHVMHLEKSRYQLYDETVNFLRRGASPRATNKHAIAVIFEVIPAEGHKEEYLNVALSLKPELEKIKGFISIERFQSIYHPEKILSLSFWENEDAIREWRNLEVHRAAQSKGRAYIFKDYHLRIAQVVRDYGMFDRLEAPADSRIYHR